MPANPYEPPDEASEPSAPKEPPKATPLALLGYYLLALGFGAGAILSLLRGEHPIIFIGEGILAVALLWAALKAGR